MVLPGSSVQSGRTVPAAFLAPVKVLIVEADPPTATAIALTLEQQGYSIIGIAATGPSALQQAIATPPDIVLLDFLLPGVMDSLTLTRKLHQQLQCPVLSLMLNADSFAGAMLPGQLLKPLDFSTLGRQIEAVLRQTHPESLTAVAIAPFPKQLDLAQLQSAFSQKVSQQIRSDAVHPAALANRRTRLGRSRSPCTPFSHLATLAGLIPIFCISLDQFQQLYRQGGQAVGDRVLQTVAERVTACVGAAAIVGYPHCNEFVVILPVLDSRGPAIAMAQKLLAAIAQPIQIGDRPIDLTASLGAAFYPRDGQSLAVLLQQGRQVVHQLQQQGGNRYEFHTHLHTSGTARSSPEPDLQQALNQGKLALHYQPRIALQTGAIVAIEACLRWHHSQPGMMASEPLPSRAEAAGRSAQIGIWLLQTACQQLQSWQQAGLPIASVAVPLPHAHFKQEQLASQMAQILQESCLSPQALELEIDEVFLVQDATLALRQLRALTQLGVTITIAAFGSRHSSVNHLHRFPCHRLKLNPALVRAIHCHPEKAAIVSHLIQLAHHHRLHAIAPSVATEGEFNYLRQQQCDLAQGHWFSHPLPAAQIAELLSSSKQFPVAQ